MRIIDFISPEPWLYILKNECFNTKIGIFSSKISIAIISTTNYYIFDNIAIIKWNSISNSPGNIGLNNTILNKNWKISMNLKEYIIWFPLRYI